MSFFGRIKSFLGFESTPKKESPPESIPPPPEKEPPIADKFPPGITRQELTRQVIERKERLWGQRDRPFNPQRSARNVANGQNGVRPNIALLKWAAAASDSELVGAVSSRDPDYGFLFYK